MSFAGFTQVSQICTKRNLRNFKGTSVGLRSCIINKLKPSEFRKEVLYKIFGRSTAGLPLALSSNSAPHEFSRWIGGAGCSRLMSGLIPVPMHGSDYRLEVRV
jgi:hypothetical protein